MFAVVASATSAAFLLSTLAHFLHPFLSCVISFFFLSLLLLRHYVIMFSIRVTVRMGTARATCDIDLLDEMYIFMRGYAIA